MRHALAVALFACAGAVGAQDKCTASAAVCFADSAMGKLHVCQYLSALQLELQNLNGKRADLQCIDDDLRAIEPQYTRAIKAAKGAQSERLKDFYASWRAAENGIRPSPGEIVIAYKTRQSKAVAALTEKAERIKLD